jgi:ABC-type transport system substrate-binding protein
MNRSRLIVLGVLALAVVAVGSHQFQHFSNQVLSTNLIPAAYAQATPSPSPSPSPSPTPAFQACTPGYWKQPQHFDSWVGFNTTDTLGSVFTNTSPYENTTLLDALSFQGGPGLDGAKRILLRTAVAALLNSTSINYPLTTAEVISAVDNALASGDRNTILAVAAQGDAINNAFPCPLN